MTRPPKKARLEVRVEQSLLDAVNEKAELLGVTNSWIIRVLIQNHLQDLSVLPYNPVQCTASAVQPRTTPDNVRPPSPARAGTSSKKKDKKNSIYIQETTERVICRVNEFWPGDRGFTVKANTKRIGRLLKDGFTADDMIEVVEHKAAAAARNGDWQWFKPDTIFKPTKFPDYLDNARAGVTHRPVAFTDGEKRARRFEDRREADYSKGSVQTEIDPDVEIPPM